jgi:hypothetical protein
MHYMRCEWIHAFPNEPVLMYSELDDDRWEIRKVEIFADGTTGYASESEERGGSGLGTVQVPSLEEIAKEPEFRPSVISKDEFERVWNARLNFPRIDAEESA